MGKSLVIVESPAKARTIRKFLGRNYDVKASVGHVRDLPRSQFGVDIDNNFAPRYITIRGKGEILQELRQAARKVDRVLLATDPDREGEAISWHLAEALKLDASQPVRIEFQEVTKKAVQEALKNPRPIDQRRVDAYHGRRVLDRLVGYKLSPLLWDKVRKGLSAGRVQSVAARLICDREREIEAFVPEEYWSIRARLEGPEPPPFTAKLHHYEQEKVTIPDEATAQAHVARLQEGTFVVAKVQRRERKRHPAPPFTTSTLQQEAARRLGFTARRTMSVAQQLYEGLDVGPEGTVGLITYMRTDSVRVAEEAQQEARAFIEERHGPQYRPSRPPQYRSRADAQGAHEAIRPTSVFRHPDDVKPYLNRDQAKLYQLIWERFVASQMTPAVYDTVTVDVENGPYMLRATGSTLKFPGFMVVYREHEEEGSGEGDEGDEGTELPPLNEGDVLTLRGLDAKQHFTQPPPRYTEAALVKAMEEAGIGRPSTYAPTIETLRRRGYVEMVDRRFVPTELGFIVVDLLKEYFPTVVDVEFTARMEARLDEVEEGRRQWTDIVAEFYEPFSKALEKAYADADEVQVEDEVTDEVCELCGRNMVIKTGRYGKFLACPGFPECRNTKPLLQEIGVDCPECGRPLVERRTRKGRIFYGCSGYPECTVTSWKKPVNATCPRCGSFLVEDRRGGRVTGWSCGNSECDYTTTPGTVVPASGRRDGAPNGKGKDAELAVEAGVGKEGSSSRDG